MCKRPLDKFSMILIGLQIYVAWCSDLSYLFVLHPFNTASRIIMTAPPSSGTVFIMAPQWDPNIMAGTLCTISLLASITPGLQLQPPLRHHQELSCHIIESPGTGQKYLVWPVRCSASLAEVIEPVSSTCHCHSHIKHGDRSVISYFHLILLVSYVLFY